MNSPSWVVLGRTSVLSVMCMRHEGVVRVKWTREELKAVREALEITPNFEGRLEAREVVKVALRTPRMRDVTIDLDLSLIHI